MSTPHDSWADHYDLALERTFGSRYGDFTARTLEVIRTRAAAPARVVDFGAGTGRLAVPLALEGYEVTAVDPSSRMLARLTARLEAAPAEAFGGSRPAAPPRLEAVISSMQDYRTDRPHDLALCVFSVVTYLLDRDALEGAAGAAAAALRPGGLLLLDVPSREVFVGHDVESTDVIRCVDVEPLGGGRYRYRESGAVRAGADESAVTYEDDFELRHWEPEELTRTFEGAGFRVREDVSDRFTAWGAGYLLMEL